ncbi:MAG: hypothetical protein JO340_18150 [Acidobacteriaceae bacterium]|nr:hypothetical protein [Acidobacteriaceae bacterium]
MIFELLFILLVLISLALLITAGALSFGSRGHRATGILTKLGISWILYLSIVLLTAALTRQQIIPANRDLCFDEMCFAVVSTQTESEVGPSDHRVHANGAFRIVTLRVSSRARGRVQREGGLRALLWSPDRRYRTSTSGQSAWQAAHPESAALTTRLRPGESVLSDQVFDVPTDAPALAIILSHGFTPGYFVIGECPLFHKPTILRLPGETN